MAILQMQRISICAMKKDRKSILEQLQTLGVVEVDTSKSNTDDEYLQKMDTSPSRQSFEKNAALLDRALEVLQEFVPEKKTMFSALEGKALIEKPKYQEVLNQKNKVLSTANDILAIQRVHAENAAAIAKTEAQIESLEPWIALDVPMNFKGTKKVSVIIGAVSSVMTLDQLYEETAKYNPDLDTMELQIISVDKDQTCIAASCLVKDAGALEEALRSFGFARPSQTFSITPAQQKENLENQITAYQKENQEKEVQMEEFAKSREALQMVSDYFRTRSQKYEVLGEVLQSKSTFVLSGYIAKKNAQAVQSYLTDRYELVAEIEDLEEDEEPPIALQNGTFAGSFEGVVESFGLPTKDEVDPSKIVSIFYVFLFGLMLSDFAYGLIVFLACFIVIKKFPRMSEGMNKSLHLFMYCGVSTMFWGVMFSGYFGDAVTIIAKTFLGTTVEIPALWFVPLNDPMKLLVYSMLFGTIHLFAGLGVKGFMCIRDKRYLDFVCDVLFWYMMLIGLLIMLLPSSLFASISQMNIVFPAAVNMAGKGLAIAGAAGILLMSGRSSKNPVLRVALGAYDLYNITGWISDVLSYSRLLALGLATGVIASVLNQMGSMFGSGILGAVAFIIVFIIGHTFNLGINLLGAYVHTCRLQYVEFFGKFFEGGGRAFNPFKTNTKYVDIKEDTKI